jgi:antitoxin Phd
MATWQLQDAKAKLSEVIDTARRNGPQIITQRGVKTAVVMPFDEWQESQQTWKPGQPLTASQHKENLDMLKVLQSGPEFAIPPRGRLKMRKPVRF